MARLRLILLGTFEAWLDDRPLKDFQSNKVRALLAYLAIESNRTHSREALTGLFWPEKPEQRARANLSQSIYNLRKLLDPPTSENSSQPIHAGNKPMLLIQHEFLQLNPQADIWVDVHDFDQLVRENLLHAQHSSTYYEDRFQKIQKAAELYQGDFLSGMHFGDCAQFEEWIQIEGQRLEQLALNILHALAECQMQRGSFHSAQDSVRRQIEIDPFREAAHRQLIRLLAIDGQRNAALTHFNNLRKLLELELGVTPARETVTLFERILGEEGFAPESPTPLHNLPVSLVPMVGRKRELGELRTQLLDPACRLLSVIGPGGCGKTRLAVDVARTLVGRFAHGIFFMSLSSVVSVDSLIINLSKVLGLNIHEKRSAKDQLFDYLREKDMLLLLDSFESILEGTGLISEILQNTSSVKILATTRLRLNIQDEYLYHLEGLEYKTAIGSEDSILPEAMQLFLAGAQRVQPSFKLNADNHGVIAEICQLVQGIPLAILLADAWVETLSVEEILREIRISYTFLDANWADTPPRQRSLNATFDYSWNLLRPREQILFPMLSIFQGGFTREAAEQVAGASVQELRTLIDKTFLGRSPSGRYSMHDMLRQYGVEKLASGPQYAAYRTSHSNYYLKLIADRGPFLKTAKQQEVLNEIHPELVNIRTAWDWAVEKERLEIIGNTIDYLCLFFDLRILYLEGERACRMAAEMITARKLTADQFILLTRLEIWQARFNRLLGRPEISTKLHQICMRRLESLPVESDEKRFAKAFLFLETGNAIQYTNLKGTNRWYLESLELYRSINDKWGIANALCSLGESAVLSGQFADSIAFYKESLSFFRSLGDPRGIAVALIGLGGGLFRVGQLKESEDCMRETIRIFKELEDQAGVARSQYNLSRALFLQGRYPEVIDLCEVCAPILKELGLQYDYAHSLGLVILALCHLKEYEKAKYQIEELQALCHVIDYPRFLSVTYSGLGMIALAKGEYRLACENFQEFIDIQDRIGNPDEKAAGGGIMGGSYVKSGDLQLASQHLHEALQMSVDLNAIWSISWILPWVALLLAKRGEVERAVEVYAMATNLPMVVTSMWLAEFVEADIITACDNIPQEVITDLQERGKKADLFVTAAKLLDEIKM